MGEAGTVGLILNRPTNVLLSEALPDFTVLKRTTHRLFAGGPVERTQLVLLFRLTRLLPDTRQIVDGIYVGTPRVLERIITQPNTDRNVSRVLRICRMGTGTART